MLYLATPSQKTLDDYYKTIKDDLQLLITGSGLSAEVQNYLNLNLESIITGTPRKILAHHYLLMRKLVVNINPIEYNEYFKTKKNWRKREPSDIALLIKYNVIDAFSKIFDYKHFISENKKRSYDLANNLNRNTCTYCNRLFTNTVIVKDLTSKRVNDSGRITRPQFDHWFTKNRYPILALSFYNLIPSCSVCNSSIKGDTPFSLTTHVHPYLKEKGEEFKFSYYSKSIHDSNVKIDVDPKSKIAKTIQEFKINEVYNAHSSHELKDLLELRYKYSDTYLETLFNNTFSSLGIAKKEAFRLIFGVEYDEDNFHKRSFSKFKRDILAELGIKDL